MIVSKKHIRNNDYESAVFAISVVEPTPSEAANTMRQSYMVHTLIPAGILEIELIEYRDTHRDLCPMPRTYIYWAEAGDVQKD